MCLSASKATFKHLISRTRPLKIIAKSELPCVVVQNSCIAFQSSGLLQWGQGSFGVFNSSRLKHKANAEGDVFAPFRLHKLPNSLSLFFKKFWTCGALSARLTRFGIVFHNAQQTALLQYWWHRLGKMRVQMCYIPYTCKLPSSS